MTPVRIAIRALLGVVIAATALLALGQAVGASEDPPGDSLGEIVIKVTPGTDVRAVIAPWGAEIMGDVLGSRGIYLVKVDATGDDPDKHVAEVVKELDKRDGVLYAEQNRDADISDVDRFHHWDSVAPTFLGTDSSLRTGQDVVSQLGLPEIRRYATGSGVIVAVIDTGVDIDHPDLVRNLVPGFDYVDDDTDPDDTANGLDDDGDGRIDEGAGHGTHVAGLVTLVAPDATILPLRVLDSDGSGNVFVAAEAIRDAVDAGADVINLSFGYDSQYESEVFEDALKYARKAEVVIVAAAGNDATDQKQYPAASKDVLSVGAVDTATESAAGYSNRGKWVTVGAPGVDLVSTVPGGYARWSGTSMATPIVSGEVAILKQLDPHKMRKAKDVHKAVRKAARDMDVAKEFDPKFAIVDLLLLDLGDAEPLVATSMPTPIATSQPAVIASAPSIAPTTAPSLPETPDTPPAPSADPPPEDVEPDTASDQPTDQPGDQPVEPATGDGGADAGNPLAE
ncbi:MAG: S8 family serine peptidase [Acidimicrobiales bacterium]|nr:S8 family serine peptidase [Acidimicrobiales bacterium]